MYPPKFRFRDNMGDDKNEGKDGKKDDASESGEVLSREASESSIYATEDDEDAQIELGPKISIKEHLEKDKVLTFLSQKRKSLCFAFMHFLIICVLLVQDDESLRRWKEQLLGSVDVNAVAEIEEPDVKIISLAIVTADRPDIVLEIPESGNPKGRWFTLKEGSRYNLRFSFKQLRGGGRWEVADGSMNTQTTQMASRGMEMGSDGGKRAETLDMAAWSPEISMVKVDMVKTKFLDDDNKCYLDLNYTFDIQKEWPK
ncbi:Immunoglobulin E-set [Cynara cardunculus var. scolymus]|uniref:Immunoglobulin E-set n=1 Tax=Cynara cardunculus var. scolymus TaxID=59895 RepID=A0A103XYG0_CYNCS|nr:Immunoglobulin E-set [Cynara cardunculus var. scolymus]